jgi:nicotinate phosphoribosyltransferase
MDRNTLGRLYKTPLGLLTDLYQLTMACGYWRAGMQDAEAVFHLFFRRAPFDGGFTVAAGLATAIEYLELWHFAPDELAYLETLRGADDRALFDPRFLEFLAALRFTCDVDAIAEGTLVFPNEPLLRVCGPLIAAQIVESALLNVVNFQTLIATKSARVVRAAAGDPVLEFGLRRAQGIDGSLAASRAAYIGGCAATSNVLAGRLFDIPVKGTHAHSWVLCFDGERDAFLAYADALPGNCIFLVDTFDTLQGVRNAIAAGRELRRRGREMLGIRLDSGELAELSIESRRLLDEAGFPNAAIVASNDLDEAAIADLKARGATIGVWGVGTRLVTAWGDPALSGVYKLSAIRRGEGPWQPKLKLSEDLSQGSVPGILQVRRYFRDGIAMGDMICDEHSPPNADVALGDGTETSQRWVVPAGATFEELLVPVFRDGRRVGELPSLEEIRARLTRQWKDFADGMLRTASPERYPVGWEVGLRRQTSELMDRARGLQK